MRRSAAILVSLLLFVLPFGAACRRPLPREPKPVTPSEVRTLCSLDDRPEISGREALCIARLAGLRVKNGAAVLRDDHALDGSPVWIVEEICTPANPHCLGIVLRVADGAIVNRRYVFTARPR